MKSKSVDFDDYFTSCSPVKEDLEKEDEFFKRVQQKRRHRSIKSLGDKIRYCSQSSCREFNVNKHEDEEAESLLAKKEHEEDDDRSNWTDDLTLSFTQAEQKCKVQLFTSISDMESSEDSFIQAETEIERDHCKLSSTENETCSPNTDYSGDTEAKESPELKSGEDEIMARASATSSSFFFLKQSAMSQTMAIGEFLRKSSKVAHKYMHIATKSPDSNRKNSLWSF